MAWRSILDTWRSRSNASRCWPSTRNWYGTMFDARNSDGTMRRADRPKLLTNRSIIARWVEAETLHLKRLGMGYQAIADHIVEVAHGRRKPMVPVPHDVQFPPDYQISLQAIHRAFRRAIVCLPNAERPSYASWTANASKRCFCRFRPGF